MGLILIGVIKEKGNVIGLRLLDVEHKETKDVPKQSIINGLRNGISISGLGLNNDSLVGTNGTLDRYPLINAKGKLVTNGKKSPLVIIKNLWDKGYLICDGNGKMANASNDDVVKYASDNGIANGKVVEKDGKKFVSSINGTYERVEEPKSNGTVTETKSEEPKSEGNGTTKVAEVEVNSKVNTNSTGNKGSVIDVEAENMDVKVEQQFGRPPVLCSWKPWYEGLKLLDEESGMTVEQKLTKVAIYLRELNPFTYALYAGVERVPLKASPGIHTMAVSIDKMFFACEFVQITPIEQLLFIVIHEMYHIIMKHVIRRGDRDAKTWNIATDGYINRLICEQFGITDITKPVLIEADNGFSGRRLEKVERGALKMYIMMGEGGVNFTKIDTNKDIPETIYNELIRQKEEQDKKFESNSKASGNGNGGAGDSEAGSAGNGEKQQGQGQGQGDEKEKQQSQGEKQKGKGQGEKQQGDGQGQGDGCDENGEEGGLSVEVVTQTSYREYNFDYKGDTFDDVQVNQTTDLVLTGLDKELGEDASNANADVLLRRALEHTRSMGLSSGSPMERIVAAQLAPKVDFRALIRRQLLELSKLDRTFKKPDKKFIHSGMVMPGLAPLEPDALKGVKVCIDTSGSISDTELAEALGMILQLLKQFKASGEIVYWDTRVAAVHPFKDKESVLKSKPAGGGGTNPRCVFEYFESQKCKIKPRLIIFITDGGFDQSFDNSKWKRKYKDCIWIINSEGYDSFKAPFGRKAKIHFADK